MSTIQQLIEDADIFILRELCVRSGYRIDETISERTLRATVLAEVEAGLNRRTRYPRRYR